MVVAVVVVSPRCVVIVSDDHATITPGIPALAGVVTNQSCLVKQRRAVSDLNLVGGVGARGNEATGAGEQCQCQFSHVHFLSVGALRANVSTKAPFQQKLAPVVGVNKISRNRWCKKVSPLGTSRRKPAGVFDKLVNLFPFRKFSVQLLPPSPSHTCHPSIISP